MSVIVFIFVAVCLWFWNDNFAGILKNRGSVRVCVLMNLLMYYEGTRFECDRQCDIVEPVYRPYKPRNPMSVLMTDPGLIWNSEPGALLFIRAQSRISNPIPECHRSNTRSALTLSWTRFSNSSRWTNPPDGARLFRAMLLLFHD